MPKKPVPTKVKPHHAIEGEVLGKKSTPSTGRISDTTIYQFPNKPILIAIFAFLVSGPLPGLPSTLAYMVGLCALAYWSYLEVVWGVNGFRRLLGWMGAVLTLNLVIHRLF